MSVDHKFGNTSRTDSPGSAPIAARNFNRLSKDGCCAPIVLLRPGGMRLCCNSGQLAGGDWRNSGRCAGDIVVTRRFSRIDKVSLSLLF